MSETGIVRKTDTLGRIVLPSAIRKSLELEKGDFLYISFQGVFIVMRKYKPLCVLCNEERGAYTLKEKCICEKCMKQIISLGDECLSYGKRANYKNYR